MASIPLTKGQCAIVDDADFDRLNQWKWHAAWSKGTKSFYAVRSDGEQTVWMHREIVGLKPKQGFDVDHINHDTLDNRRSNLRRASHAQNCWNQRRPKNNSTGYKGVVYRRARRHFVARIRVRGKLIYLGSAPTAKAAHEIYVAGSSQHFGEFAGGNDAIRA